MARAKLKFRLHRAVIVLFCLALLVALMQGASWFSQNHQRQRNPQLEELARTLAHQVTLNIAPLMRTETPDEKRIKTILQQLTKESRILDAGVYDEQGDMIARAGESVNVRDRLALDGKKAGGYFNQQIVEPIQGKNGPLGYLRLTLDTHTLATEARQVDNTTNILRLMLLLSLAIGVVLTRTLLQGKRTRWQQSPFLLTANKSVPEEEESEKKSHSLQERKTDMSTLRLLISDSYDPGLTWRSKSVFSVRCPPLSECCFCGAMPIRSSLGVRKTRGKSAIRGGWKRTTCAWRAAAAAVARSSTISAIPVSPLWPGSRNTIRPSRRQLS